MPVRIISSLCLCVISVILFASGVAVAWLGPRFFEIITKSKLVLSPESEIFQVWKHLPVPVPVNFYFFNWTNPEDVHNKTVKPKFHEVGPYRFMQDLGKTDVIWNDNGTVTYKQLKFWYYSDEKGNGNLKDNVTTLDPVLLGAVHVSRNWHPIFRGTLSFILPNLDLSINITRTVGQMLFEGYPDTLVKITEALKFSSNDELSRDKFGWFYMRNGSADSQGVFNMGTGKNTTFGRLYQWNYWTDTPYFEGSCAKVGGSAGEFFERGPDMKTIRLFSADLCRTIELKYVGKKEVHGIIANKYVAEDHMLDNGTVYPENRCACNGECVPSGVVNVTSCRLGSPFFGSLPHFFNADPYFNDLVEGLNPEEKKHEFFIVLEPATGIPLKVNVRLQVNLMLHSVPGISMYKNVPTVFFPMLWFEQKHTMPKGEAHTLKLALKIPVICSIVGVMIILIGLVLLLYALYIMSYKDVYTQVRRKSSCFHREEIPLKILENTSTASLEQMDF